MLSPVAARAAAGRFSQSGSGLLSPHAHAAHHHHGDLEHCSHHHHSHQPGQQQGEGTHPDSDGEEDKQEARYSSRYLLTCLLGYSLAFVVFGSQVSILGPTIAALAERLNVSEADMSPLFTALGVSCIVSGTPSGWLVDRVPTHHVLIGSLLVEAVGFALVPLMPSVWSLTALYFVVCFSYNFTNSAVFTSLAWMFPKRAGPGINLVLAMFGLGSFFIPLAAQGCKLLLGSPLAVFYLVSGTALVSAVPFLFVSSPSRPQAGGGDGDGRPAHHASRSLELTTTAAVISLVFCTTAAETAIGNWVYTFSRREAHLADGDAALANSAFWGAFTLGRVLGAAISHATTPATLLLGSVPLSIIGCALPLLAGRASLSYGMVLALAALTGLGNSAGYANAVALLERYVPVTGFINGLFGAVAGGACMVGPVLVALLAKYTTLGYMSMPWVGLLLYGVHLPIIATAILAGNRLLQLDLEHALQPGQGQQGAAVAAGERDALREPLLAPAGPHQCCGHDQGHEAQHGEGQQQGHTPAS